MTVKDFFYNMTWEEVNKPFQKHHVVTAFEEFKKFKFKKHINLQLGAGVDKLFHLGVDYLIRWDYIYTCGYRIRLEVS